MKRITIFHNKDCVKCRRIARVNRFFDWLGRVDISTADPRIGPMRPGEIAVEDARTGEIVQGVAAVRRIYRNIPAYWPLLPLLSVPFIARRIDRETRGCDDGSCAVPVIREGVRS
jgi:hypothetical protein